MSKTDDDFKDGKHLITKEFGNFGGDCPISKKRAFTCEVAYFKYAKIRFYEKLGNFLLPYILRSVSPRSCCAIRLSGVSGIFMRIYDAPGTV